MGPDAPSRIAAPINFKTNLILQGKKQWSMPRKDAAEARGIQPGDVGIWATCAMKKEGKSVADLRDLFQEVCFDFIMHTDTCRFSVTDPNLKKVCYQNVRGDDPRGRYSWRRFRRR